MLTIAIPHTHQIGETVDMRIHGEPARLTWADADTLVINGTDRRHIFVTDEIIDGAGRPCWSFLVSASQAEIATGEAPATVTLIAPVVEGDDVHVVAATVPPRPPANLAWRLDPKGRLYDQTTSRYLDGARERLDGSTDAKDAPIIYRGTVTPGPRWHITVTDFAGERPLPSRLDIISHSPTGFAWGYGGSGPNQSALALLCDALGDIAEARQLYQQFKLQRIATLNMESGWTMTRDNVLAWVSAQTVT